MTHELVSFVDGEVEILTCFPGLPGVSSYPTTCLIIMLKHVSWHFKSQDVGLMLALAAQVACSYV